MTWFKVDDSLAFHHKTVGAGNAAMGLWVRAGSWSAQQLTDGYVPEAVVGVLGTRAQADRLVRAGLWDEVDGGYQFHEWSERQPSRKEVLERRKNSAERQKKSREARAQKNPSNPTKPQVSDGRHGVTDALVTGGVTGGVRSTRPDPTRPVLIEEDSLRSPSSQPVKPAEREDPLFGEFWDAYPRKVSKGQARKAWKTATKTTTPTVIVDGVRRYRDDPGRPQEAKYIPHPATWLNGERWADAPTPRLRAVGDGYQPWTSNDNRNYEAPW